MLALIMAGGSGKRLNLGEKPLVTLNNVPMIMYVISAFLEDNDEIIIVTSPSTPYTFNWARVQGYNCLRAPGMGYISDLHEAVKTLEEKRPFFTCVADIPCLKTSHVEKIRRAYGESGKEALSVWVPAPCRRRDADFSYSGCIDGINACPAGINIIRGDLIHRPQEEFPLLIRDPNLAYNVNTREDLEEVRRILASKSMNE